MEHDGGPDIDIDSYGFVVRGYQMNCGVCAARLRTVGFDRKNPTVPDYRH